MAAFSPEPTDSGFKLANWLFGRLVVLVALTGFVAISIQFAHRSARSGVSQRESS